MAIVYLTDQGKSFNPKRGITIGNTQYPPKWFMDDSNRARAGVTTKEVFQPDFDDSTQSISQDDTGEYVLSELPLEKAKERRRQTINQERNERLRAGIAYGGNIFDSDDKTIQRITAIFTCSLFDPDFTAEFITKDNKKITLTNADCKALGRAAAAHEQGVVFTARQMKDSVISAKTNDDIRRIKWPVGGGL